MMSVFFDKAQTAMIVTGFIWFALYIPFWLTDLTYSSKLVSCLFSNSAMAHGFSIIFQFEAEKKGMQWSDMWSQPVTENDLTVGLVICFMVASSFVHLLIALYAEPLLPGKYILPQKWYYPFTKAFWCGTSEKIEELSGNHQNSRVGVKMIKLRKVYSHNNEVIKDISLSIFNNEVTVLLGHQGSGKSTIISMLIGILRPTSGTAIVNGHDIQTNINEARNSMGFCPQHNILFDELSVREHIEFYCALKGVEKKQIQNEVNKYVEQLKLKQIINAKPRSLSRQSKRKLSGI